MARCQKMALTYTFRLVIHSTGKTIGRHLGDGSLIYITAEIVLGFMSDYDFIRETDPTFGYKELIVFPRKGKKNP